MHLNQWDGLLGQYLRQLETERNKEEEAVLWKTKLLHGMYNQQKDEVVGIQKWYWWLA